MELPKEEFYDDPDVYEGFAMRAAKRAWQRRGDRQGDHEDRLEFTAEAQFYATMAATRRLAALQKDVELILGIALETAAKPQAEG